LFRSDDRFSQFSHVCLKFIQLPNPLFGSQPKITDGQRQVDAKVASTRGGGARLGLDQPSFGCGVFDLVHWP
jgi:hypothetical protein